MQNCEQKSGQLKYAGRDQDSYSMLNRNKQLQYADQ
jgi:hypothetical protein